MRVSRARLGALIGLSLFLTFSGSVLLAHSLGSGGCFEHPPGRPTASPPNILMIVTDDQRAGLSVMPNTRRIFRRGGTDYTNAFVSDPLCCPSRASIFTGRYPHNDEVRTEEAARNLAQGTTVQHYLQQAGYCTTILGKYLNSWPLSEPPPYFNNASFFRGSAHAYRDADWNLDGQEVNVHDYSTGFISRGALRFLREANYADDSRPWFLYLATAAPHFPFVPAKKYARAPVPPWSGDSGTREGNLSDKPQFILARKRTSLHKGQDIRRRQFRTLMSVDDMVGKIFAALRRYHEGNTLAFYTSDNGYLWGEHQVRGKELPYTESLKVPLLTRWPGHIPPGVMDQRLVSNVDLAPTIMDAAGLKTNPLYPMDGRSLFDTKPRKRLYAEYFNDPHFPRIASWATLRTTGYQYTEYYEGTNVVFREYYDLKHDPGELHNDLADPNPRNDGYAVRASLLLGAARSCAGRACP